MEPVTNACSQRPQGRVIIQMRRLFLVVSPERHDDAIKYPRLPTEIIQIRPGTLDGGTKLFALGFDTTRSTRNHTAIMVCSVAVPSFFLALPSPPLHN